MCIDGYRLLQKVATGGTSEVWKAEEIVTGRVAAIKTLLPGLADKPDERRAFVDEEIVMAGLSHPGIIRSYGHGVCEGVWYNVLEYVDGYTVAAFLKRKVRVPEVDCLLIAESVASALDYAWQRHGIVHCDLKPDNLMISAEGEVKIIDLGSIHRVGSRDDAQGNAGQVVGTPAYIAPEQVEGLLEVDSRSDIYSLGASLYHLATGRILFPEAEGDEAFLAHESVAWQAPDPREVNPVLSLGFARLLEAMLVKDREGRISSWSEVFACCREIENGGVGRARSGGFVSSVRLA